jgi:hypothetical protein
MPYNIETIISTIMPPSIGKPGGGGGVGGGGLLGIAKQSATEESNASNIRNLIGTIFIGRKSK